MKKLLLSVTVGLVALGMAAPALAADLGAKPYVKAPPPPPPVYDWSGFYIGVNGGGGSGRKCWDLVAIPGVPVVPFASEGCHDATGGTAGGQIGYRWQIPSNYPGSWVFGIEGQGNWADFRGSNTSLLFAPDFNVSRINAFGLLTGQVGYAWNNVLFYVKGGGAVTGDRYRAFAAGDGVLASASETRWGGTVGAGVEYGFAPNWSVGFEYDHLFMGNRNVNLISAVGPTTGLLFQTERIRQNVDIGLIRINYRFGPWGSGLGGLGSLVPRT
jgi:outer membrane immunogenic protein